MNKIFYVCKQLNIFIFYLRTKVYRYREVLYLTNKKKIKCNKSRICVGYIIICYKFLIEAYLIYNNSFSRTISSTRGRFIARNEINVRLKETRPAIRAIDLDGGREGGMGDTMGDECV